MVTPQCAVTEIVVNAKVPVRAERPSALYQVGEEIRFKVAPAGKAVYTVHDGTGLSVPQDVDGDIVVKAEKPGFILVHIQGKFKNGRVLDAYAGAAVEPEKIGAGFPRPADFDEFWDGELKKLRSSELELISRKPVPAELLPKNITAYDVHVRRGDIEVSGFVALPSGSGKGTLPGTLNFLGASKVSAELDLAVSGAARYQAICFNVNFHGLENFYARDPEKEAPGKLKVRNYQYLHADDRDAYAMRKIFLRTVIASDYIQTLPEYNGNLGVSGGSLGGCQSIVCAALVPEVQFCCATASAMSNLFGANAGHIPGWPNIFATEFAAPGLEKTISYFDVVNFVPRLKCPVVMAVGFIDTTTPPASTYAAYNALTVKNKKMYHVITGVHGPCLDKREVTVFEQGEAEFAAFMKNAR